MRVVVSRSSQRRIESNYGKFAIANCKMNKELRMVWVFSSVEAQYQAKDGDGKYLCRVIPCSIIFLISSLDITKWARLWSFICSHNNAKTNMKSRLFACIPDTTSLVSAGSPSPW